MRQSDKSIVLNELMMWKGHEGVNIHLAKAMAMPEIHEKKVEKPRKKTA